VREQRLNWKPSWRCSEVNKMPITTMVKGSMPHCGDALPPMTTWW